MSLNLRAIPASAAAGWTASWHIRCGRTTGPATDGGRELADRVGHAVAAASTNAARASTGPGGTSTSR
jgi:hypothetical protein